MHVHGMRFTPCPAANSRRVLCSIFVLASCEGFRQAEFSLWCCNSIECNREFTSEFLLAVGAIQNPLDQLTCVEIGA